MIYGRLTKRTHSLGWSGQQFRLIFPTKVLAGLSFICWKGYGQGRPRRRFPSIDLLSESYLWWVREVDWAPGVAEL